MFEPIAHSLIFHERFTHIAHFLWATWVIRSRSLICLERSERIAHSHSFDLSEMSEWANSQPWKLPIDEGFYANQNPYSPPTKHQCIFNILILYAIKNFYILYTVFQRVCVYCIVNSSIFYCRNGEDPPVHEACNKLKAQCYRIFWTCKN